MKKLLLCLVLLLSIACNCGTVNNNQASLWGPIATPDVVDVVKVPYAASVIVFSADGRHGSGTILRNTKGKPALILTVLHVLHTPIGNHVVYCKTDQKSCVDLEVDVVKIDEETDLALLTTKESMKTDGPAIVLATAEPKIGEEIWTVGNPAFKKHVTRGTIANKIPDRYVLDISIWFGNSGGGVFNLKGELIAIIQSGLRTKAGALIPAATFARSLETIRAFLPSFSNL